MSARAYPLSWPKGWPRTELNRRESSSRFQRVTVAGALSGLREEVRRLGGKDLVLSSNYTLGNENPKDPAVVAYFALRERPVAIPCDRWDKVEGNVRAIALTIEAMRGMERWGAKSMIEAMFTGFTALPQQTEATCWEVLGIPQTKSEEDILIAWRRQVKKFHPDNPETGNREKFEQVDRAKDTALQLAKQ
jgi:hypothetical protein